MMTMQDAATLMDDTLEMFDKKSSYYSFLQENRAKFQESLLQGNQEIQKTIAYLSEFGRLIQPISKLQKFIKDAEQTALSYDAADQSLQDLAKISNEELMEIYQVCYTLFQEKQFEKAASVAFLLGCLNQEVSAFWRMLGLCYQNMGNDGAALTPFLYASMVNSLDGSNHACALSCLLKLGLKQEAQSYYETAKEVLLDLRQEEDIRILDALMAKK